MSGGGDVCGSEALLGGCFMQQRQWVFALLVAHSACMQPLGES